MITRLTKADTHGHRARRIDPFHFKAEELKKRPRNTLIPEQALVISLERSKEARLNPFLEQNTFNGTMEVVEGIDGLLLPAMDKSIPMQGNGDIACLRSHRKALQFAKDKGYELVAIFEDDIRFVTNFNEQLRDAMRELPDNWDMLYLGGKDRNPAFPYSKNLKANACMWGGYAIVFRNTVYDFFIELFQNETKSCDDVYSLNSDKFVVFKTANDLCIHIGRASDRIKVNHVT